jgi:predicted AlkP superfamily pyrophosphatase or phosphodiesterase
MRNRIVPLALLCSALLTTPNAHAQIAGVKHVVIIGVDGMAPFGIEAANTPVMDDLMERGSWTMRARGVLPTSSSPNWASMIMGAGPEQHGITENSWQKPDHDITPIATSDGTTFPTIFWLLKQQRPKSIVGIFHDWDAFGDLMEKGIADRKMDCKGPDEAVEKAVDYFKETKPAFTFIHLDHVDHAGHSEGWRTPAYIAAVENADLLIGKTVQGLKDAGMYEATTLIVTSDHGGKGKGHGGDTMAEIEIPWILTGPGVKHGYEIPRIVNTYDTAATVAYIFGLKPHEAWIAKPVIEAFEPAAKSK